MVPYLTPITAFCTRRIIARTSPWAILASGNWRSKHHVLSSRRTISSGVPVATKPFTQGATLRGQSGRTYTIQEVLAERRDPLLCVYRARYDPNPVIRSCGTVLTITSAEGQNFIVKNMIPGEYEYQQDLQKSVASCPNLRTVVDGLPGPELSTLFWKPTFSSSVRRTYRWRQGRAC